MLILICQVIMRCWHYPYLINEPWLHHKMFIAFSFIRLLTKALTPREEPDTNLVCYTSIISPINSNTMHIPMILYVKCMRSCKHENPFWCCCEGWGWCNWWSIACWYAKVSDKLFLPHSINVQPSTTLLTVHAQQDVVITAYFSTAFHMQGNPLVHTGNKRKAWLAKWHKMSVIPILFGWFLWVTCTCFQLENYLAILVH